MTNTKEMAPTLIFTSFGASFFTSLNSLSPKPTQDRKCVVSTSAKSQVTSTNNVDTSYVVLFKYPIPHLKESPVWGGTEQTVTQQDFVSLRPQTLAQWALFLSSNLSQANKVCFGLARTSSFPRHSSCVQPIRTGS